MVDHRVVATLLLEGRTYREIETVAGVSHRDISKVRKVLSGRGLTLSSLVAISDEELAGWFPDGRSRVSDGYDAPDFKRVVESMRRNRHFTLLAAWRMYCDSSPSPFRKYGYAQYCHLFGQYARVNDLVATLDHEPGRAMMVDWAGDTVPIVDAITGEVAKAYLFVAVLPFSGMVLAKPFLDMRMPSWLSGHIAAFEYFGGVPQLLVPDHAATATHRKAKGDGARFVSDRYQQMADHYGCAVVPARVRRPRDKAAVEPGVNVTNTRILGYLLEETWTTVTELGEAVAERVSEINHDIRRKRGDTRAEQFQAEEAAALGPLPAVRFEEVDWRQAKVARNYHVSVESNLYSVPYRLAGQLLRVRLTASQVAIFDGANIVAAHPRKTGRKGQYSTNLAHAPERHRNIAGLWSRDWFVGRARLFGPATEQVIGQLLDRRAIEAQGYLDCQNVLGHLGRKGHDRLEAACQQLLNMRAHPSYSALKRLIAGINSDADKQVPITAAATTRKPHATASDGPTVSLRGADYYRQEG